MENEERKKFIQLVWKALQKPSWSIDDLKTFGRAIYTKQSLKDMSEDAFNQVFPHLVTISNEIQANQTPPTSTPDQPAEKETSP